jgi:rsbT antagonist protein RsbS
MRVPILRLNAKVLIVALGEDLTDDGVMEFQNDISQRVARMGATGVVIDVSALDIVDSFMARVLNDSAQMLSLLGAQVVVCGMQPAVAMTLVEMGRDMVNMASALTLERALTKLEDLMNQADLTDAGLPTGPHHD